jgi:hypothetical protein
MKNGDFPISFLYVYQRVDPKKLRGRFAETQLSRCLVGGFMRMFFFSTLNVNDDPQLDTVSPFRETNQLFFPKVLRKANCSCILISE